MVMYSTPGSCDTFVALAPATSDGLTLFGKNSDREPDEAQNLEVHPPGEHPERSVKATHISVPGAKQTCEVLLCRPFWMFGAEMGANRHGVVIGNEALFTKEKPGKTGLTGMDLLRLALERSVTAKEALDTIVRLLEEHGQGGRCGYRQKIRYMNGFLIADAREAYVLETVRSWWAWKRINDFWSISNIISLTDDFDECSPGLIKNAVGKGWCRSESEFNFRDCYSDLVYTKGARGASRQGRSRELLQKNSGRLSTLAFMQMLRDHGQAGSHDPVPGTTPPGWRPDRQGSGSICMHAANRLTRPTQSVCSLVCKVGEEKKFIYSTGAGPPCMSPFFPLAFPRGRVPGGYEPGNEEYEPGSFWWESERAHRRALYRFEKALEYMGPKLSRHEQEMVSAVESGPSPVEQATSDHYFAKARQMVRQWDRDMEGMGPERPGLFYRRYWRRYNRLNKVPGF